MENLAKNFELPILELGNNNALIQEEIQKEILNYTNRILALLNSHNTSITDVLKSKKNDIDKPYSKLKILCVGSSPLCQDDIFKIFNDAFFRNFGYNLSKKSIESPILEYKKMKNFDLTKKIKSNRYDFIILGPRPHSTANKGINVSLFDLKKRLNLKAVILDSKKDVLNKSLLEEIAEQWTIHFSKNKAIRTDC